MILHITALINRRTQSADVSFEMLDNRDGKPIDVDKIKEKEREVLII